jgi:alanyl-tRNA synthetase
VEFVSGVELVKARIPELGGRGGGRRDFAQGGGPDGPRAKAALAATGGLVGARRGGQLARIRQLDFCDGITPS